MDLGSSHLVKHFLWQGHPSDTSTSENNYKMEFYVGHKAHMENEVFDQTKLTLCGKWDYTTRYN